MDSTDDMKHRRKDMSDKSQEQMDQARDAGTNKQDSAEEYYDDMRNPDTE